MGKREQVIDEIRNKVEDFEDNFSNFFSEFNEWSDLFTARRPTASRGLKRFSNPRLTEMFRAINALATLEVRMMTSQDPYFELVPMDLASNPNDLVIIQNVLDTQLKLTEHKRFLLKACISKNLFGSVIVEEPFEIISVTPFGRMMPATKFIPRSLLQVAFDRNSFSIDEADWLTTSDLKSNNYLMNLADSDPDGDTWIRSEIEAAINDEAIDGTGLSTYIINRLNSAGYNKVDDRKKIREILPYYGKLDTMNDGVEYNCVLINRKYLAKFKPNNFQHGRRQFRVAHWVEYELEPLGYGIGKLLSPLHKSLDANRQKVQDSITFDTYAMWIVDRLAGINVNDFKVLPNNILESDNVNGLKRLESNVAGATLGIKLEEILKEEFRSASGATNTLQALVTEATASEVSLAQNEALRNISVKTEIAAEHLVRQHLEICHANNVRNVSRPFNININGAVKRVYPNQLQVDVDFKVKVVTDKDYKPQRLKSMIEVLQILTSIRNEHPDKFSINIVPIVMEIARSLNIDPAQLVQAPVNPLGGLLSQIAGLGGPSNGLGAAIPAAISQPAAPAAVETPIGPVLASP